MSDQNIYSV